MKSPKATLPLLICAALVSACDSDDNNSTPTTQPNSTGDTTNPTSDNVTRTTLDATAGGFGAAADDPNNKYTYYNLDSGQVVELSDEQAASSTDWHLGFKRTSIKVNGGASGSGSVTATVLDAQDDYYSNDEANASVFTNASADSELQSLTDAAETADATWSSDANQAAIKDWYTYDINTHTVSPNTDQSWVLRSAASDSYALMKVTAITTAGRNLASADLALRVQGVGETAFATEAATFTATLGEAEALCVDFDASPVVSVDCAGSDWDLRLDNGFNIWTNGAVFGGGNGAAFGPIADADLASTTDGASVAHFFTDSSSGVFSDHSWYAYNLQGSHKLWPNYRVYGIDTGSRKHKLQITGYYNEAGTSGHISIRHDTLGE